MGSGGAARMAYRAAAFFRSTSDCGDAHMTATNAAEAVLQAALEYASLGWRIVPLYGIRRTGGCECKEGVNCEAAGKHPRINEWENHATTDEDKICNWWSRWPNSNVGVHMGEASGIVDLECDSPEAEEKMNRLFDGNIPVVPTYQSKRGKHRLFRWRADLPNPDKARFKLGSLDVLTGNGGKGQQSVFPPSVREDAEYKWLIHPSEAEPAVLSEDVVTRMHNLFGEDMPKPSNGKPTSERMKLYTQDVIRETVDGRDDTIFKEACNEWRLYRGVYGHAAFTQDWIHSTVYRKMWAWNQAVCQPLLDEDVIKQKVESAKAQEQKNIFEERSQSGRGLTEHGLEWHDGELYPGDWSLTVILSKPPVYLLKVPAWQELIGGDGVIELSVEAYRDANAVASAIFTATKTVIIDDRPGAWPAIWNGTKGSVKDKKPSTRGLKAKLLEKSKSEEAPIQHQRPAAVAELLAEKLAKAGEREEPDHRGKATRLPDGSIWIRWSKAWEEDINLRRVTAVELQQLARSIGIAAKDSRRFVHKDKSRLRYFVLSPAHVRRLDALREYDDAEQASA